jgi:hypothetical protein
MTKRPLFQPDVVVGPSGCQQCGSPEVTGGEGEEYVWRDRAPTEHEIDAMFRDGIGYLEASRRIHYQDKAKYHWQFCTACGWTTIWPITLNIIGSAFHGKVVKGEDGVVRIQEVKQR